MNKQNTETETTRSETLKKWTLETLCNIAILISGHPEIEDDVLDKICEDIESEELAIHTYLKSLHPDPEAPLYKVEVIDIDTMNAVGPYIPTYYTNKESAYEYLKRMEDDLKSRGWIGIVKPVSKNELDNLGFK